MRLRHIEIFHAVYVSGSVNRAAKSLNVSQPTVSKVLRHAEGQLGFELFHRESGRIFPSENGKLLFQQILPVFEQINELKKYAAMLASKRIGQLRLAMTPAFSLEIIPKVIAKFARKHSDISIELEISNTYEISKAVLNQAADLGLIMEAVSAPGLSVRTIGTTRFVCVSQNSVALSPGPVSMMTLIDKPLIQLNAKSSLGQMLNTRIDKLWGWYPKTQIVAETYHLAKHLAAQGAGFAIVDKITALSGGSDGLSIRQVDDLDPININLIHRTSDPLIGYKAEFCDQIQEALSDPLLR